jgi:hypothetical protein
MPKRVSRRERRRRLYYLLAVVDRIRGLAGPDVDLPGTFAVSDGRFNDWVQEREPVPAWIPQLAIQAYRVPPPPKPRSRPLLLWILAVVLGGLAVSLLLQRIFPR